MQTSGFLRQLAADGALLADAARGADWDVTVPGIAWSAREVLVHTGCVHRWSADIVRRRLVSNETGGSSAFHPGLPDDEVLDWYLEGLGALVTTLTDAPEDLVTWTFTRGVPARAFWSRRQAHETAIHRADLEAAAGLDVTPFAAEFAQDGLHELLGGFARERAFATTTPGRLGFLAADGGNWLVTFGGERIVATVTDEVAGVDATVSGSSSDLYRWAWNRPSPATVDGDPAVAELWRGVRIT